MGNPSKQLGTGLEVRVVNKAVKKGMYAKRQPGSGAYRGYPNDVVLEAMTEDGLLRLLAECKVRSTRPSLNQLLEWLAYVESNAAKNKQFSGAFLVYNDKGSKRPVCLLDLDLFLNLLGLLTPTPLDDSALSESQNSGLTTQKAV
jgi:hypothetical protein